MFEPVTSCKDDEPWTTKFWLIYNEPVMVCVPIKLLLPVVAYPNVFNCVELETRPLGNCADPEIIPLGNWTLLLQIPLPFNTCDDPDIKFVPVATILPVIEIPLPNWILLPSDDNILFPAYIVVVPFNAIIPFVGSIITSPPPELASVIFPSFDWSVIVSDPASNILNDCPASVVICNSCVVLLKTFVPSMYNDADERYKSLNWCVTLPKS